MYERIKFFVGLDAHKDSIAIAACEAGREPAQFVGTMGPDVSGLLKLLAKAGEPAQVSVVYEAGPTGYGLHRELCRRGYRSQIVAPSLIPRRAGERIKNDRRDCLRLAELSRAGELKAIWVPDEAHEAMRNLWRAREDAVGMRLKTRQQPQAFLLRHGRRYPGKTNWTKSHERWIAEQRFEHDGDRIALGEYQLAAQAAEQRVDRLTTALTEAAKGWRFEPVVAALRALRGIDTVCAIGLVTEIGDISRFGTARQLMAYLGLVPSEHSRGDAFAAARHQDRQRPRQATADRGGVELPLPGAHEPATATAQQRPARAGAQPRLEGPAALVRALRALVFTRRSGQQGMRGGGP